MGTFLRGEIGVFKQNPPQTKKASPFRLRSTQASGKASHWFTT